MGDTGHWWGITVPLLASGALLRHARSLPPLPLLSQAHSVAPLSSSGSSQIAWLSFHLTLIHWLVSTRISSLLLHFGRTNTHVLTKPPLQPLFTVSKLNYSICSGRCYWCFDPLTFPRWPPLDAVMRMTALKALLLRVCACTKAGVGLIMLKNSAVVRFSPNCLYVCVCVGACMCVVVQSTMIIPQAEPHWPRPHI